MFDADARTTGSVSGARRSASIAAICSSARRRYGASSTRHTSPIPRAPRCSARPPRRAGRSRSGDPRRVRSAYPRARSAPLRRAGLATCSACDRALERGTPLFVAIVLHGERERDQRELVRVVLHVRGNVVREHVDRLGHLAAARERIRQVDHDLCGQWLSRRHRHLRGVGSEPLRRACRGGDRSPRRPVASMPAFSIPAMSIAV